MMPANGIWTDLAMAVDRAWSIERALEEQQKAEAGGLEIPDPSGPLWQWQALQQLDHFERQFVGGDDFALLHAIRVSAPTMIW